MTEAALQAQNWAALLRLELRRVDDKTRLVPLERYGPLSVQRPFYPEGECCHVYLLHPPGGVVGGDRLDLQIELQAGARSLFTAPGAAKFYLSAGATAEVRQQFRLDADAGLEFLPQANIYFPGALVDARTSIDAEPGARLLLWEKHCFGRPANHERFDRGSLRSRIELRGSGKLLYTELQRVDSAELQRASGFRGQPVCGTLLAYGAEFGDDEVAALQRLAPEQGTAGISRLRPDLLLARYIGPSTSDLDKFFIQLWERLRPQLLKRNACRPRIWNT
jgi:urease accessory protein